MVGRLLKRFVVKLLELDDTPREIARGIAIGVFIAMTPTVGIQMTVIALACTLLGGNRLAGVAMAWISNPLTLVPVYWLDYVVGSLILRSPRIGMKEIARVVDLKSSGIIDMFLELMRNLGSMTFDLAGPMFLGGAIVGLVCAVPSYYVSLSLFTKWKAALKKEKEAQQVAPGAGEPPAGGCASGTTQPAGQGQAEAVQTGSRDGADNKT